MRQYTDLELKFFGELGHRIWIEHLNQLDKWGVQTHTAAEWVMFTTEELGSLAKAIGEYEYRDGAKKRVIDEAIQVATLALKIAEMYMVSEG